MIKANINGKELEFAAGSSILEALRRAGDPVPTLCNDERLKPIGSCRMCLVEVAGHPHPVTACSTELLDGMTVRSATPALEAERRMLLKMLAHRYPREAFRQFPEKEFHRYALEYGLNDEDFADASAVEPVDDSHPYIRVDMDQCIRCYRCARICAEVQGQFVWQIIARGSDTRIVPDSGTTLADSSCVSCGACVDTCPTGALEDKTLLRLGTPTAWTRTTCPYCGTGCELRVGTREQAIVTIEPVLEAPVSRGHLCVKGRYAFGYVSATDRITQPLIKEGGDWRPVSWDHAFEFAAERLKRIVVENGVDSVGVLGSARATNEENYLAQKFARVVLGTNNVDCCARVCHAPTAAAMSSMLGTGAATNSYDDIEVAKTILLVGANATENHPIIGARIRQVALNGTNLIVIDPRRIELAHEAVLHLRPRPGTNIPLLNAMAHTIVIEKLCDLDFVAARVDEFEKFCAFINNFAPDEVQKICDVDAGMIREAARLYATTKPAISFHGLGLTEQTQGTEAVMCLVNLALLTGNIGKPGTGINPLRGQNNVQGSVHMGCEPGILTGGVPLAHNRARFSEIWKTSLPNKPGLNLLEMMDAASEKKLKALWAIGYDIFLTNADAGATERALSSLEFLIVQDMFLNETARRFADLFLPAASSFEKEGTFMNAERRVQLVRKAIEPPGEAKSDWEIIVGLARTMGKGEYFNFKSAQQIWDEVRLVWEAGAGMTYSRLESQGLQWPCPAPSHPGTQILHNESFASAKKAALRCVSFHPTTEVTDEHFPYLLTTGRNLYQFNAGTMTWRTANAELRTADCLDICRTDADLLKLVDGELVRVRSRYGEVALQIHITSSVRPGELFATFHTPEVFLNRLTGPLRDSHVDTPEFKVTAVAVEKISV